MTDMWNGRPLPERGVMHTNIHYRLYDRRTGELLSFNSTNSLDCFVADVLQTQQEHPNAQLVAIEYDGPAWPDSDRPRTRTRLTAPLRRLYRRH